MQLASYNPIKSMEQAGGLFLQLYQRSEPDPGGDLGLIGPGAVWRVLGDNCILVGGVTALMMQMLHPRTMMGVYEHSNYTERPLDRLVQTGNFVRGTTYGSTTTAEQLIAVVRKVHERVEGKMPDGSRYYANDPDQLRWVHVCEAYGFVRAHQRFHPHPIRGRVIDRYYDELAVVGERLGAAPIPRSRKAVNTYFESMRPQLASTEQSIETIKFIMRPKAGDAALELFFIWVAAGAVGLLPSWARKLHGLSAGPLEALATPTLQALFHSMRLALGPPAIVQEARQRVKSLQLAA